MLKQELGAYLSVDESSKSPQQKLQEQRLLQELVNVVNQRDELVHYVHQNNSMLDEDDSLATDDSFHSCRADRSNSSVNASSIHSSFRRIVGGSQRSPSKSPYNRRDPNTSSSRSTGRFVGEQGPDDKTCNIQ